MTRNMVTSLFRYERISTTKAKALEIRRAAEKMITRAKVDSVHNRRIVNKDIKDAEVLNKLFTEIGPLNLERPGGYTRVLKTGLRKGDAAEMVILELVRDEQEKKGKSTKKKAAAKAEPKKAVEKAVKKEVVKDESAPAKEEKKKVEAAPEEKKVVEEAVVEEAVVVETATEEKTIEK